MNGNQCAVCGNPLGGDGRKRYCSPECTKIGYQKARELYRQNKKGIGQMARCECCGMIFTRTGSEKFCSKVCQDIVLIPVTRKMQREEEEKRKQKRTLEKMTGDQLLSYGKISAMKQIEKMRMQKGV